MCLGRTVCFSLALFIFSCFGGGANLMATVPPPTGRRSPPGRQAAARGWSRGRRPPSRPGLARSERRSGWWTDAPFLAWGGLAAATGLEDGAEGSGFSQVCVIVSVCVRRCYLLWTSRRAVLDTMPASFLADTVYQPASSFMAGWMIMHR